MGGETERGGRGGEAGAALARGNFLLGAEALGMVLPMSGLTPKEAYVLLCSAGMWGEGVKAQWDH